MGRHLHVKSLAAADFSDEARADFMRVSYYFER